MNVKIKTIYNAMYVRVKQNSNNDWVAKEFGWDLKGMVLGYKLVPAEIRQYKLRLPETLNSLHIRPLNQ